MAGIERFTTREEEAIRGLIVHAERSHDPMIFSAMLAEVSKQFRKHPLRFVEGELRRLRSGLYLVASPMTPEMMQHYEALMPHTGRQEYPFGLAYFMGERHAWRAQLRAYGASPEENAERLDTTGFLNPKRGTVLSRWARAASN